jgi:hypothetical protein
MMRKLYIAIQGRVAMNPFELYASFGACLFCRGPDARIDKLRSGVRFDLFESKLVNPIGAPGECHSSHNQRVNMAAFSKNDRTH